MIENNNLHMPLFEEAEKKFTQHLLIENNDRIIFSGKFGHGKTTFLKEFFREDNQKLNLNGINFKIILYIQ